MTMKAPKGEIVNISEVFPDTDHAILVFLSKAQNDCFTIWSEHKKTEEIFTIPRIFKADLEARTEFNLLVNSISKINVNDLNDSGE